MQNYITLTWLNSKSQYDLYKTTSHCFIYLSNCGILTHGYILVYIEIVWDIRLVSLSLVDQVLKWESADDTSF